jgi:hypothetical protein
MGDPMRLIDPDGRAAACPNPPCQWVTTQVSQRYVAHRTTSGVALGFGVNTVTMTRIHHGSPDFLVTQTYSVTVDPRSGDPIDVHATSTVTPRVGHEVEAGKTTSIPMSLDDLSSDPGLGPLRDGLALTQAEILSDGQTGAEGRSKFWGAMPKVAATAVTGWVGKRIAGSRGAEAGAKLGSAIGGAILGLFLSPEEVAPSISKTLTEETEGQ